MRWDAADAHIGEFVSIEGPVVSTFFASEEESQPTFLNIGSAHPDPDRLTVLVWGSDRDQFAEAPEVIYDGRDVCVTGLVELYRGVPEMIIDSPSDILVREDEPAATTAPPPPTDTTTQAPVFTVPPEPSPSKSPQWDPVTLQCSPLPSDSIDREWQTSDSPERGYDGGPIYPADRMVLGLRNHWGTEPGQNLDSGVRATVVNPQGVEDVLNTYISGDQWAEVTYPADLYDMWSGVHTVIWTTDTGEFLACSGFEVVELFGE